MKTKIIIALESVQWNSGKWKNNRSYGVQLSRHYLDSYLDWWQSLDS